AGVGGDCAIAARWRGGRCGGCGSGRLRRPYCSGSGRRWWGSGMGGRARARGGARGTTEAADGGVEQESSELARLPVRLSPAEGVADPGDRSGTIEGVVVSAGDGHGIGGATLEL